MLEYRPDLFRRTKDTTHNIVLAGSYWPVLPLYIVELEYWSQPDASHRHFQFMSECLAELRDDLSAIGQPLILRVGAARDVLDQLSKKFQIHHIFSHEETGLPFVDAYMRCLTTTGWMNFRMRAMLVAVASYHFWLDWPVTGEYLARLFTDYEPDIQWSQMQMQSGTTGINTESDAGKPRQ